MRRPHFIASLAALALLGATAAWVGYRQGCDPELHAAACAEDPYGWLRCEFALTERQVEAVRAKHAAYQSVCARHCADIQEARALAQRLRVRGEDPTAADRELKRLEQHCVRSLEAHLREVALLLPEAQRPRYLELVLGRLRAFDHEGAPAAPDLSGSHNPGPP